MEPSTKAFELICLFEASNVCRLKAYLDTGGVPTIGWGTTVYPNGKRVKIGDTCTEQEANSYLENDVKSSVVSIKKLVKTEISQSMFDALVSFVYNLGAGQFGSSTLLKHINAAKFQLASQEFPKWKFDNGVAIPGLLRRRLAEQKLFNEGLSELGKSANTKSEDVTFAVESSVTEAEAPASKSEIPFKPFRKNRNKKR
jgi:lysozyme